MSNNKIYLASPHMSDEGYEMEYIKEAFDTNWIAPLGTNVTGFEKELAEYVGSEYAVALSSGTAALHMALKAADVKAGDIVFCQSLTFAASANPIIYENAVPVFIDSEPDSWNMSPVHLKTALEKYPQVKAVIVVHLYGFPAKIEEIAQLCKQYQVTLIEDAAESLGALYNHQHTGIFGDYGIFSFNGNKIITTSGGGMLIGKDKDKLDKVRFWATQARDQARHYQHSELGFNYRMSNVVAGIGRGQLKVLNQRVNRKQEIFKYYYEQLGNLLGISFMPALKEGKPNYWLTCIQLSGKVTPLMIIEALEKENIEARPIWKPMHLQPYFAEYDFIGDTTAENIFTNGVCLPSDTKMTQEDIVRIVSIIKGLWEA